MIQLQTKRNLLPAQLNDLHLKQFLGTFSIYRKELLTEKALESLCMFLFICFPIVTAHNPLSYLSSLPIFIGLGAGGTGIWTGFQAEWRQEGFQRGQGDKDYVQRSKAPFSAPFKVLLPLIPTTVRASQLCELLMYLEIF